MILYRRWYHPHRPLFYHQNSILYRVWGSPLIRYPFHTSTSISETFDVFFRQKVSDLVVVYFGLYICVSIPSSGILLHTHFGILLHYISDALFRFYAPAILHILDEIQLHRSPIDSLFSTNRTPSVAGGGDHSTIYRQVALARLLSYSIFFRTCEKQESKKDIMHITTYVYG